MSFNAAITIGDVFWCGILKSNSTVYCWGDTSLDYQFRDLQMESFAVRQFHEHGCGNTKTGVMVCRGFNEQGQLSVPANSGFEFSSFAASEEFNCAIKKQNGELTCWGGGVDR
ncbi:Putative serine/threonine-protein kinase-like protein CCR3 [Linum perenne]